MAIMDLSKGVLAWIPQKLPLRQDSSLHNIFGGVIQGNTGRVEM